MPMYEYEHESGACSEGHPNRFERLERMTSAPIEICPVCGQRVHRILSVPGPPNTKGNILSPTNLAAKGFTQYTKIAKGEYKKTAGEGPQYIAAPPEGS